MVETTRAWSQTSRKMSLKRKTNTDLAIDKWLKTVIPKPERQACPEGNAHIIVNGRRSQIRVLLDSGSNIFLINAKIVKECNIPYATRKNATTILGFDGNKATSGGKHFTHPIVLEIGKRQPSIRNIL